MHVLRPSLFVFVLLLAACEAAPPPSATTAVVAAPAAAAASAAPPRLGALESRLKKGMPYDDLRRAVLSAGWLPLSGDSCDTLFDQVGMACLDLPELHRCDGKQRCTMGFARGPSEPLLRVDTHGPIDRWQQKSAPAVVAVDGWSLRQPEPAAPAARCPSQDFTAFFSAFAADSALRRAFTLPLVREARLVTSDRVERYDDTYVRAADFKGFTLVHRDDGFHATGYGGTETRVEPDIRADGADVYRVAYADGRSSKGKLLRFERQRGCWYLAAAPEPR